MEKKGGQRDKAQRGGASERRPGPAAPGGSFPAPTLLCSLLHGLLPLLLRSGRHSHRRALAFPLSWPPHFLGSAFGRALPQEPGGGAGPFPASLLSLSIHCAPRAAPMCSVQRAVWCLCCRRATALSLLDFAVPRCRALCSQPSPQPHRPPLLSPPFSCAPAPWAARSWRPWYFVSLLFCKGRAGSVTCAALYGAVCKNKPVGILVVSVPSRSRRPGPAHC